MCLYIIIIRLGVISSNMENSALGNNKNYLSLLSNIIAGKKPVWLVIFPLYYDMVLFVLTLVCALQTCIFPWAYGPWENTCLQGTYSGQYKNNNV